MDKRKSKSLLLLIICAFLTLSTLIIAVAGMLEGPAEGQPGSGMNGLGYFKAFTNDSNIFSGAAAFILLAFAVNSLYEGRRELPRWAVCLQFTAACSVGLTFVTTALFLGPTVGISGGSYFIMFRGSLFFFHFLNPVLAMLAFVLLEDLHLFGRKEKLFSLIPTVLYSWVYFCCVIVRGNWTDFYGFARGNRFISVPISFLAMYGGTWLIASLLIRLHNRRVKKALAAEENGVLPGRYRHFKGNRYEAMFTARHSETEEELVVYRALYGEKGLWARPAAMWNESVERDGKSGKRFSYDGDSRKK